MSEDAPFMPEEQKPPEAGMAQEQDNANFQAEQPQDTEVHIHTN
jgi:hypothetical protein